MAYIRRLRADYFSYVIQSAQSLVIGFYENKAFRPIRAELSRL
jgi:hypothetical protein